MSVGYTWVQWNRHKRVYDAVAAASCATFIALFVLISKLTWSPPAAYSDEVLLIRATGACAFLLLHVILALGPLTRLSPKFLPLLYNRRHLGVMTFVIALVHGIVVTGYYHGFGIDNPLVSLLASNLNFTSWQAFPFQLLGLGALLVLLLLAVTSHDFWNKNLSPSTWKRLHMSVYVAYALLVAHVALGALQSDRPAIASALVFVGAATIASLHIIAGVRERAKDRGALSVTESNQQWIDVGHIDELPEDRARTVCTAGGERIAVFKHNGAVSAVTNVCAHQGGPLGEGKVIDGCITCPWHGWQYRPQDGCSPPPFQEKIATYQVRIRAGRVQVNSGPQPPGTPAAPARARTESEDAHA